MRDSTAFVISVGIGMAAQSAHGPSARDALIEVSFVTPTFGEIPFADEDPRAEAHAAVAVRIVRAIVSRMKRSIGVRREIGVRLVFDTT
jgi:hypothetical protein